MGNYNLHNAKRAKQDEFYTQMEDIEKELRHYDFKGKKVYCNCDDPLMSNFYKYFKLNFNYLGIKELISTGYNSDGQGYYGYYDGVTETIKNLEGNGDFRSAECIEFLKQADVVVTNPPFSLFREYVAQLMEYGKKFLIIGNGNAVTYKEIFPLIKNNELWLGCSSFNSGMYFRVPDNYEYADTYKFDRERNGEKVMRVSSICWWTNIENTTHSTPMDLYKKYSADDYPKYDNYDAIEVSRTENIPMDYDGVMGVPITFLDKYCPTQFEIIWTTDRGGDGMLEELKLPHTRYDAPVVNGRGLYKRIFIRKRLFSAN